MPQYTSSRFNSTATYTCFTGYWFERDLFQYALRCTEYGRWQIAELGCIGEPFAIGLTNVRRLFKSSEITCPNIPVWDGKVVDYTGVYPGDSANCSCSVNKTFPGNLPFLVVDCQPRGVWSKEIPECIGIQVWNTRLESGVININRNLLCRCSSEVRTSSHRSGGCRCHWEIRFDGDDNQWCGH